jgi:phage shock protein A
MIDAAEDPEKMVNEYLRQMRAELSEARAATAMAMADETRLRSMYEALAKLEAKIDEAEAKRDLIVAKTRRAATQEAITSALQSVQGKTADESLGRMESQADERLARAQAMAEVTSQDLDSRFSDLETERQVEDDLAGLKQKYGKS